MVCTESTLLNADADLDQALVKRGLWRQTLMYDWLAKLHTCVQARWQTLKRFLDRDTICQNGQMFFSGVGQAGLVINKLSPVTERCIF